MTISGQAHSLFVASHIARDYTQILIFKGVNNRESSSTKLRDTWVHMSNSLLVVSRVAAACQDCLLTKEICEFWWGSWLHWDCSVVGKYQGALVIFQFKTDSLTTLHPSWLQQNGCDWSHNKPAKLNNKRVSDAASTSLLSRHVLVCNLIAR